MTKQFVTFYLDDDLLGLDIRLVREVHQSTRLTPVTPAPDFVRGLLNLRGQIVTILDPGARLGIGQRYVTAATRYIVLKTYRELERTGFLETEGEHAATDDRVGLLVDRIGDIVTVDDSQMRPPPTDAGRLDAPFLAGIVELDQALLVPLNMAKMLEPDETHLLGAGGTPAKSARPAPAPTIPERPTVDGIIDSQNDIEGDNDRNQA